MDFGQAFDGRDKERAQLVFPAAQYKLRLASSKPGRARRDRPGLAELRVGHSRHLQRLVRKCGSFIPLGMLKDWAKRPGMNNAADQLNQALNEGAGRFPADQTRRNRRQSQGGVSPGSKLK
jgi:hypothetical protein